MRIFIAIVAIIFFLATGQVQSQAELVPVSQYGQLENKSMFAISPSGEYIAYRSTDSDRDLVLVASTSNNKFVSAVDVSDVNPSTLFFVDEDKLVMVVSENRKIYGYIGRHTISYAFAFNVKTKQLFQMLSAKGGVLTAGQTNLGRIVGISKDKEYAFMPAYGKDNKYNLYRVKIGEQARPRIYKRGTSDTIDFFIGEDDQLIARERFNSKFNRHIIESYLSGKWEVVFSEETEYRTKGFMGITPDKKSLVMSITGKNGLRSFYALSLEDGSITDRLFSDEAKSVERAITDINQILYGVEYSGFEPSYEFFDNKLNARMSGISQALPEYTTRIADYTENWDNIVFYADGIDNAGSYLLYKAGDLSFLSKTRPNIIADGIAEVKTYEYKARDGLPIPTLLTYPKKKEAKKLPAIMMPHGGPESYDRKRFDYLAQYFANRGYLVIQPQFRGSTGFGKEHTLLGRGEWGRKMQDDLSDGIAHFVGEGIIHPEKVCIVGASYGGYAALAGAVFTPELYKCVISINGVTDLPKMMRSERKQYGREHWVLAYWDDVISGGDFDKDHLNAISPINHVDKVIAPILLIHGSHDNVVPWQQSDDMFDELKGADKEVEFVKLSKGDHHLSTADHRMKAMKAIDAFMTKHMQ